MRCPDPERALGTHTTLRFSEFLSGCFPALWCVATRGRCRDGRYEPGVASRGPSARDVQRAAVERVFARQPEVVPPFLGREIGVTFVHIFKIVLMLLVGVVAWAPAQQAAPDAVGVDLMAFTPPRR